MQTNICCVVIFFLLYSKWKCFYNLCQSSWNMFNHHILNFMKCVHEVCSWTYTSWSMFMKYVLLIFIWPFNVHELFTNCSWSLFTNCMFMKFMHSSNGHLTFMNCSWTAREVCSWTVRELFMNCSSSFRQGSFMTGALKNFMNKIDLDPRLRKYFEYKHMFNSRYCSQIDV
jgi:hypothetical protein